MSIVTYGMYEIDFSNTSYINAIAKYNQNIFIDEVRGMNQDVIVLKKNEKRLSNLGFLINKLKNSSAKNNKITLQYSAVNSSSMFGVFPFVIKPKAKPTPINHEASKYLHAFVNNCSLPGLRFLMPPTPPSSLTRVEAQNLVQQYDCSGAIEIPELNAIIFEYKSACFYLIYGDGCKIGDMHNITLDMDGGFLFKYSEDIDPQAERIAQALQTYFLAWKEANYRGPLFSPSMGLNFNKNVSQIGLFSHSMSSASSLKTLADQIENKTNRLLAYENSATLVKRLTELKNTLDSLVILNEDVKKLNKIYQSSGKGILDKVHQIEKTLNKIVQLAKNINREFDYINNINVQQRQAILIDIYQYFLNIIKYMNLVVKAVVTRSGMPSFQKIKIEKAVERVEQNISDVENLINPIEAQIVPVI